MALLKLATLGALGYVGYKYLKSQPETSPAAFANSHKTDGNFSQVRDAGPNAMADPASSWSKTDQRIDESFPASDPPSTY